MVSFKDIYNAGLTGFKIYTFLANLFPNFLKIDVTVDPLTIPEQVADKLDLILSPNSTAKRWLIANETELPVSEIKSIVQDARICVNQVVNKTRKSKNINDAKNGLCNCFDFGSVGVVPPINKLCKKSHVCLIGNWTAFVGAVLLGPAVLFLIIMTLISRRKQFQTDACNARGGPVIPLNMLDNYKNRFAYAVAFGISVSRIAVVILGDTRSVLGPYMYEESLTWPSWLNIFIRAFCAIVIAVVCYPLFASLSAKRRFIGSVFGFCYCLLWFCLDCWKEKQIYDCYDNNVVENTAYLILQDLPSFICLIILTVMFAILTYKSYRKSGPYWSLLLSEQDDNWKEEYFHDYVIKLLKTSATPKQENKTDIIEKKKSFKNKVKDIVYHNCPEFRYSTRIICSLTVASITIYTMIVIVSFTGYFVIKSVLHSLIYGKKFEDILKVAGLEGHLEGVKVHFGIWITCYYVSVACSAVKVWVIIFNMLSWYRKQITSLRRGDRSWIPTSIRKAVFENTKDKVDDLVTSSMKYAGYQVSYIAWSFIVFSALLWIGLGIAGSMFFYPLSQWNWNPPTLLWVITQIWPVIVIAVLLIVSQMLAVKFFFIYGKGTILAVENRQAYHIYSYFMFFFNIFAGLVSCLTRIILQLLAGLLFLERLQKSVLPRSYEKRDPGYNAYLGYLLVEHTHANPVLTVFLHLCLDHVEKKKRNNGDVEVYTSLSDGNKIQLQNRLSVVELSKRYLIVRNRYHLIYSLLKNPELCKYRKTERRLDQKIGELNEDNDIEVHIDNETEN